MISTPIIFREYDIRGVYNEQFDKNFAYELGKAFVTKVSRDLNVSDPVLSIGHDARLSSPEIVDSLARGIAACGGQVKLLGLITTPMSYFSTFTVENLSGGIMVTGSHNPPNYNGFKISVGKSTIHGPDIKELEKLIQLRDYLPEKDGVISEIDIFPSYIDRYKEEFGKIKNIPIVIDCGNGAAGIIVRKMYAAVGLTPTFIFEEPDGKFPNHHPDPTVEENLVDLARKVKETGSLIGIGFDGDADRIGIVDHEGKMVLGDEIIAFCARNVLRDNPGAKIVGDVKCSDRLFQDIEQQGGKPIMWMTGHSLIKDKVKKEKSPFGGELSGHIFFADRNYGYDDAPYAGLRIIEALANSGKNFRELLDLPSAFNTPEIRIDTTEDKKHNIVEAVKNKFNDQSSKDYKINLIDGIRISFADGWALVRASNTQPVVVLRFESNSQEGLNRIREQVESIVNPLL